MVVLARTNTPLPLSAASLARSAIQEGGLRYRWRSVSSTCEVILTLKWVRTAWIQEPLLKEAMRTFCRIYATMYEDVDHYVPRRRYGARSSDVSSRNIPASKKSIGCYGHTRYPVCPQRRQYAWVDLACRVVRGNLRSFPGHLGHFSNRHRRRLCHRLILEVSTSLSQNRKCAEAMGCGRWGAALSRSG